MIEKILKRCYCFFYAFSKINWITLFKNKNKNSEVVLWIPKRGYKYWGGDSFIWDVATLSSLIKRGEVNIVFGNRIGNVKNKKIFYTLHENYNLFAFENYVSVFEHICKQLVRQGNVLFPKASEVEFWENKIFMHKEFDKYDVNAPLSYYAKSFEDCNKLDWEYPFLVKEPHSCSANGVHKVNSKDQLVSLIDEDFLMRNENFIFQKLINMRRDLRVIVLEDEIIHYYWRINKDKDWKPTSTGYGSLVDFENFPLKWEENIVKTLKDLKLTIGAFDVAWENDDLDNKPQYLEVSPVFQPNPKVDEKHLKSYGKYKKGFSLFNSWDKKYVNIIFDIKEKYINKML